MKTKLHYLLSIFFIIPFIVISQVQIGQDLNGEATLDYFGYDVSLSSDGTIVATCAPYFDGSEIDSGLVRIFENVSGVWTQIGQDIIGEDANDYIGNAVSLSSDGTIVAIGSSLHDGNSIDSGLLRVYENIGGVWTQIGQDIYGEAESDRFGRAVSLSSDGQIVAASSIWNDGINGSDSGHVRIYENMGGIWTQIGQDIDGEATDDWSGGSISLSSDGSIIAIGSVYNDGNGEISGHIRVYENFSGVWSQIGQDIDGDTSNSYFGRSVSLSTNGSILAISGYLNGDATGNVRIYENISGVWTQLGQDIFGEAFDDRFGSSISLSADGSIIAIGALQNDGNGDNSGHVRIYKYISGVWVQLGNDIDGASANDKSGSFVSLSSDGTTVAICSTENSDNGLKSGEVRIFDLSNILNSNEFVLSNFSLFPNPAQDQFTIQLQEGILLEQVNIYNGLGQLINTTTKNQIKTSNYTSGLYYVEIQTNKGKATKQLIIE